ncbi:hypothetical protein FJZ40_03425 [Candidatus Shapirobacteria bacterium]|nr:hypothetical protein [Candidatus Shapirobacteria bacterium]
MEINVSAQQDTPPATGSFHSRTLLVIFLGVIILGTCLAGAYFLLSSKNNPAPFSRETAQESPAKTPAIPTVTPRLVDYNKRLFNPTEKFIETQDYPQELLRLAEDELVGLSCSPNYSKANSLGDNTYGYWDEQTETIINLTDQRILDIVSSANRVVPGNNIASIQICDTEDRKTFAKYGVQLSGGGAGEDVYFAKVLSGRTLGGPLFLSGNQQAAYFGCSKPLQLTKTDLLYYQCGGEGNYSIYKVYLGANPTLKKVIECVYKAKDIGELNNFTLDCNNYSL